MLNNPIGALSSTILGGLGLTWLFAVFMFLFGWPMLAWVGVRHIRQIGRELERLNMTLEAKASGSQTGPLGL